MRSVTVIYHEELEGWWAESPDAESFFATGTSRAVVGQRVREHLPSIIGEDLLDYREVEFTVLAPLASADRPQGLGESLQLPGMPLAETA